MKSIMVENWKKFSKSYLGSFIICWLQVLLVTINTYQVSNHKFIGMAIMGFFISFFWSLNVTAIVFGSMKQRLWYAAGGMVGCITGGVITELLY